MTTTNLRFHKGAVPGLARYSDIERWHAQLHERMRRVLASGRLQTSQWHYRPLMGWTCTTLAFGLAYFSFDIADAVVDVFNPPNIILALAIGVPTVIGLGFPITFFAVTGWKWRKKPLTYRLREEVIPPVLYLRPFATDTFGPKWNGTPILEFLNSRLMKQLDRFGPVMSIGQPGRPKVALGHESVWVSDGSDWQAVVVELMSCSQLTVIEVGLRGWTLWEMVQAQQRLRPAQLLFKLPQMQRVNLDKVSDNVLRTTGIDLRDVINRKAEVIRFDDRWVPFPVRSQEDWDKVFDALADVASRNADTSGRRSDSAEVSGETSPTTPEKFQVEKWKQIAREAADNLG